MKPIPYLSFNRKPFVKILRKRFELYVIKCKLYPTGNLKLAQTNYKRIYNIVNQTLQKKITFDNNNIFLIIQHLEDYNQFIKEFSDSIKNTENIDALKDRQIAFFQKQAELEGFLKSNFERSQPVELPKV